VTPPLLVLYAEVPEFYVEAERARDPGLRERALLVGGDPRKRGQVQSASLEARAFGVEPGMAMIEAVERCPKARVVRTDMKHYRELSGRLRACLREGVDSLEPLGLEGVFSELRGAAVQGERPEKLARALQERVRSELDLPLRVGLAPVKFLARLASEEGGEEGIRRVDSSEVERFLHPLPVGRLPSVGPRTVATLAKLGVSKVGDLAPLAPALLEEALGNHGLQILEFARGEDPAPVRRSVHPQSVSREATLEQPEVDGIVLAEQLARLASGLEAALRRDSLAASRVALKVRYEDQEVVTRSLTLDRGRLASASEISEAARTLLGRTHAGVRPIRLLGLRLAGLSTGAPRAEEIEQLDLFR